MDKTLLVLAAGLGSRYGGLKQLDPVGPQGQTLMDYSVRDATAAGFTKVVFVIRQDFAGAFHESILPRYPGISTALAFQELTDLPGSRTPPPERSKPWGTAHAIWSARHQITTPFLAINADDFYGADSFRQMATFLDQMGPTGQDTSNPDHLPCALAGFSLNKTLSEHGGVSRGVCKASAQGLLESVEECTDIRPRPETGGALSGFDPSGTLRPLSGDEWVSMNFWGFPPALFPALESLFADFLDSGGLLQPGSEFYIPSAVSALIASGRASVRVLPTSAQWFGVTYRADRQTVVEALANL